MIEMVYSQSLSWLGKKKSLIITVWNKKGNCHFAKNGNGHNIREGNSIDDKVWFVHKESL